MPQKPKILSCSVIARSRLFTIEALDLRFANGSEATFERLKNAGRGIVMVIALDAAGSMIMVREYAAGTERYELGFVKGRIDPGETAAEAALRELKEEIGFGANKLAFLRAVDSAPAYTNFVSHLFVATELYPAKLEGDEAEPLEQVEWPLADLPQLYRHPEVNDSRVLLALMLLEKRLEKRLEKPLEKRSQKNPEQPAHR